MASHPRVNGFRNPTLHEVILRNEEPPDDYEPVLLRRVYFALDPDACQIKIGVTANLAKRMIALRCVYRRPNLVLLGTATGGLNLERALHRRFAEYRQEGEWFSSEIVGELTAIVD